MAPPACSSSHEAVQIRGEADLGFDFFLAIAEIVVGDDRDHHAALVAAGHLERAAVVVELVRDRSSTCRRGAGARSPGSQCGRPRSFFFMPTRCGARMTQPVWPVQCSASSAASFSGR